MVRLSSLTCPKMNKKNFWESESSPASSTITSKTTPTTIRTSCETTSLTFGTGNNKEQSAQSKTRDHAAHAGPSALLETSKALTTSEPNDSSTTLSSSWSTVTRATSAVEVDGHTTRSIGWQRTEAWWLNEITHCALITVVHASSTQPLTESRSRVTWIWHMMKVLLRTLCTIWGHCPYCWTLQAWCITRVESPAQGFARHGPIMLWFWLDMGLRSRTTGWSRTAGDHSGVSMGTWCLKEEKISAELTCGRPLLFCHENLRWKTWLMNTYQVRNI